MVLGPQLQLKQKQKLKLTQTLRQSIEIMQLDRDEIEALIQKEKEENPLLNLDEDQGEVTFDEKQESSIDVREALSSNQAREELDQDEDYNNEYDQENHYYPSSASFSPKTDAGTVIEATHAYKSGFYEDIETQIRLSLPRKIDRAIALFWLSQLDEAGRLPLKAFNQAYKLLNNKDDLEFLLGRLQQFEPAGLFARNLKECLKAQLIDQEKWDLTWLNIFDHLELLSNQNLQKAAKKINISPFELTQRLKYLKSLNPHPAWQGEETKATPITAELIVSRQADGEWVIELNEEAFNPMILNEMDFIKQNKQEANWLKLRNQKGRLLLQMLARRAESILKIGQTLLQKQVLFFEKGEDYLRPLTMTSLTEELNMHESTISRLVRNKYLYFMGRSIELRWFFQSARISSTYGVDISARSVQMRIRQIIDDEPKEKPYSDDKLVKILANDYGYKIARRTIVKYREALDIPSSFIRKRKYKNHL